MEEGGEKKFKMKVRKGRGEGKIRYGYNNPSQR